MVEFHNNGPEILWTSYWSTPHAAKGFWFLSWNAGTARVLVPAAFREDILAEIMTTRLVVITRGAWQGRADSQEILFDDGSSSPYGVHILKEQTDRLIPATDAGREIRVTVWRESGRIADFPGRYRVARMLPCLKPYKTGQEL